MAVNKDITATFFTPEIVKEEYVLVASDQDLAGRTLIDSLRNNYGFERMPATASDLTSRRFANARLFVASTSLLQLEDLDVSYPKATAFVFLSKHKSDSKIPTLTCHCTGNFGHNPFGGNPKQIGISYPSLQKSYLREMTNANESVPDYQIVIEATHHGPTSLKKPLLFVELGSSEKQWADVNAANAICRSILHVIQEGPERCTKVGIALGGTHYPSKFNQVLLESELGLAAVASKHNLELIDDPMLEQMRSKSIESVTHIVLDAKGLGAHKERIVRLAERSGLEVLSLK